MVVVLVVLVIICHNHSGSGGVVVVVVVVAVVPAVEMVVASPRRASHAIGTRCIYRDRFSCSLGRLQASTSVCARMVQSSCSLLKATEVKAENDMSKLLKIKILRPIRL